MKQASSEGVLPSLAGRAKLLKLRELIPPEILTVLDTAESMNEERNRVILTEALHVAALLNQIGIRPVALKGTAYLLTNVQLEAARFLGDIDFLIPENQIPSTINHLYQNAYFEDDPDHLVMLRHHHAGIRRVGLPYIELHHRIGIGVCDILLPVAQIFAEAKPLTVKGATILIPSPTHLVNHLILHSQLAHPYDNRIFPPLRAFVDLIHLHSRFTDQIDWTALEKTYRSAGESATLALHLQHTNRLLGTTFPVTSLPRLRWYRRQLLNRHPALRFLDPIYLLMSLLSRRLRLVPQILSHPAVWPKVLRTLTSPTFYRNLFA